MAKSLIKQVSKSGSKKKQANGLPENGAPNPRLGILKTYKIFIGGKFPRTESGRFYQVSDSKGNPIANICQSSRKDFRNAVVAARAAFKSWAGKSAYNRGQIIYRIGELLEGRKAQFIEELVQQGSGRTQAQAEVLQSIDRLVYYAGWADKYQQVFSSVNPVSSSHFNFSLCEPSGVIATIAPNNYPLLGLISTIIPAVLGGNTCVALASKDHPLCSISWSEVVATSDVPGGVVNILTGDPNELATHFASHMDVNGVIYSGDDPQIFKSIQQNAAVNLKRVSMLSSTKWDDEKTQNPYEILKSQEIKTIWHPIGF